MLFQVVLVHVAHNKDQVRATLQRSPALHVRGRHIVAWARHLAALQRHMPSMHQAALSSSALYNSFIIEACHMPGIVVGCHLLCLGSCLARRVVLQLFVQTYHRLLSAFWHFYNQCLFNSFRQVIWLECESKVLLFL